MNIQGLQKLTLLDYPGQVACTVFTGGCNFRCPFCHNGDLVLHPGTDPAFSSQEILAFLQKRQEILEGVCITGGEPTLQPGLSDFLRAVKDLGLLVKLDTNGYRPKVLQSLLEQELLDYVAMDIKGAPEDSPAICGLDSMELDRIQASVQLLKDSSIPYEFRTTVVRELHNASSFEAIGQWIGNACAYFLQGYRDSDQVISPGFSAYTLEELKVFQTLLSSWIEHVEIRGVEH